MSSEERGSFGCLLRTARQARGLTQEDLADATGISVRAIRNLERGRVRTPQRHTAHGLADTLGLSGEDRDRFLAASRPGRDAAAGDTGPGRTGVPAELPAAITDLTGRDLEMATVRGHALDTAAGERGAAAVVSVHGPPGIGKSSLAVSAGTELRELFPDGQLFVNLRGTGTEPLDPGEAAARFLRSLGVADARLPASVTERSALFRTLTDRLGLLVVLDNAADEAQVRPLLPAGRRCLVLVTSRRPLTGLECADRIALDLLPVDAGRRLLGAIVGSRTRVEPVETRELVDLCGGLPLALRIAGNRLATRPHWPVRHLVDQLRDQRQRLTALTAGDLGVRAAFDVSYRQLEPDVAQIFRSASLIPGTDFGADLVAAVSGRDPATVPQAVETLVDAGLLTPAPTGGRYRFHDLVRLYARERLAQESPPGAGTPPTD